MSSKIEVSRELLELCWLGLVDNSSYADDVRALLDAPVVEPNKCGQCGATTTDICNQIGCGFLESGNGAPVVDPNADLPYKTETLGDFLSRTDNPAHVVERQPVAIISGGWSLLWYGDETLVDTIKRTGLKPGDKLYTAPPELAELRATIARLTAEIERLKGGQGEPVAEVDRLYQGYLKWTVYGQMESPRLADGTKLYTSQPAPVSVYDTIIDVLRDEDSIREPGRIAKLLVKALQC